MCISRGFRSINNRIVTTGSINRAEAKAARSVSLPEWSMGFDSRSNDANLVGSIPTRDTIFAVYINS